MEQILGRIAENILNPAIVLLFAVALIVFIWGVLQFVRKSDDADARTIGGRHIMYGVIGMAIMIGAFGILKFITATIGADDEPIQNIENQ